MPLSDLDDTPSRAIHRAGLLLTDMLTPTLRLGVTGLSRAGKTVFITALIRNLVSGGRLPFFAPEADGRIERAYLEPQPDDQVPRFDYEGHLETLAQEPPQWPASTRRLSQVRITIEYRSTSALRRMFGASRLNLDVVDYPGEWLLDLPLLQQSYEAWSAEALAQARASGRHAHAKAWLDFVDGLDPYGRKDEQAARQGASLFASYLQSARSADHVLHTTGPGRFLMPGELEGSPLLTFCPLPLNPGRSPSRGSLAAMMARRFESYKSHVVRPFFRNHFSKLDRQIVLVDVLGPLNDGGAALADLQRALDAVLSVFRTGASSWITALIGRRIDKLFFAATKADHIHASSHDRLEAILRLITERAIGRASTAGAEVGVGALAALRATREAEAKVGGELLACIVGVPEPGERIGNKVFDGREEAAVFPGDLPANPKVALERGMETPGEASGRHFIRFRPPRVPPPRTRWRGDGATPYSSRPCSRFPLGGLAAMTTDTRNPRAFALDDPALSTAPDGPTSSERIPGLRRAKPAPAAMARPTAADLSRGVRWGALLFSTIVGLIVLSTTLWFMRYVEVALSRQDWVGWLAFTLASLAALCVVVLILREIFGLFRLARLGKLRAQVKQALHDGDMDAERRAVRHLKSILSARADLAWPLARLSEHEAAVLNPRDLLSLADRELMVPLDQEARRTVLAASKRVAMVAAISPMAWIAMLYVLIENLRMLRALAGLYGGRPGPLGALRLGRLVIGHILATGGVALTDDLLGQFLGQDLLRRLSRRLGEGAFNGALTARVGAAAVEVCRPLPFISAPPIRARDMLAEALRRTAAA